MPLGNLTSQFFANVYLNELDYFIKHELKAKYYIRYVDDFVILHHSRKVLEWHKNQIDKFLKGNLEVELHPNKSYIVRLDNGIGFLGFRLFYYHKLVKKNNARKFEAKFNQLKKSYKNGTISREKAVDSLEGWLAYVSHADTYKYRKHLVRVFNDIRAGENKKTKNFAKKLKVSSYQFSSQKTLQLFKKGLSFNEIAAKRNIKESTVWQHLAMLIEYNQLSVWKVLPENKIRKILSKISSLDNKLKEIKERLNDSLISLDEINCVLAHFINKKEKKK